jgi:serine/threonine protein kinase
VRLADGGDVHRAHPAGQAVQRARDLPLSAGLIPDGVRIGRYVIDRPLPGAPPGTAFIAHDTFLGRLIVLRLLAGAGPAVDAAAMSRLAHPNLVRVLDGGRWQGGSYLALEHIEGPSLAAWLRERRRRPAQVAAVMAAAARGLEAAHAAGVVHGRLGPDAVVVADGRVAVGGFGLVAPPPGAPPPTAGDDVRAFARMLADLVPVGGRLPRRVQPLLAATLSEDPPARPPIAALAEALERHPGRRARWLATAGVAAAVAGAAFWMAATRW